VKIFGKVKTTPNRETKRAYRENKKASIQGKMGTHGLMRKDEGSIISRKIYNTTIHNSGGGRRKGDDTEAEKGDDKRP